MQHCEVLLGCVTDERRLPRTAVGESDLCAVGILDDVEVGDDVPLPVPDEAGAGAAGNLHHVEAEEISTQGEGGDVGHRRRDLLEEIGEHPTLVVYEFQHDKHRISRRHLDWPCLTGMSGECLQTMVQRFDRGEVPRLLIQSSQAHGLNIQAGCSRIVFFGMTWNWEDYKQMVDRVYRQGQSASMVMVYRILAEGTLDQDIAKRLEHKMEIELDVKRRADSKRSEVFGEA